LGKTEEARNCKEKINEIKNKKEAVKDDSNLSTNIQIDSMNKSLAEKTESQEIKTKLQNTKENIFKKSRFVMEFKPYPKHLLRNPWGFLILLERRLRQNGEESLII
jgi:hypothetical protein